MRSLFILSLPCSYSSQTFQNVRRALGLQEPLWITDGEILNVDRSVLPVRTPGTGLKFTTPMAAETFARVGAFLDQNVRPTGFIYKDVVQPFVCAAWLAGQPGLAVLKILPDPTHVVASCLVRNWSYPAQAADEEGGPLYRLVQGVVRAERAILATPGEAIPFDALIGDEAPLREALQRLYPEIEVPPFDYVTPEFRANREIILQRRQDPAYAMIDRLVAAQRGVTSVTSGSSRIAGF